MHYYRRKSPPSVPQQNDSAQQDLQQAAEPTSDLTHTVNSAPPAADLVQQAAAIMQQEMAAGAQAAQQATIGTSVEPALPPMWSQLATQYLPQLAPKLQDLYAQYTNTIGVNAESEASVLRPKAAVSSGSSTEVRFKVHNDHHESTQLSLQCSDLRSATGAVISSQQLRYSPANLELGADQMTDVTLMVTIPAGSAAGTYSGLITAPTLSYLHAVLVVEVI